jgi:hypothetical protein
MEPLQLLGFALAWAITFITFRSARRANRRADWLAVRFFDKAEYAESLEQALLLYGRHAPNCMENQGFRVVGPYDCNCYLKRLLK